MISFSQPALSLANQIQEHVSLSGLIPITLPNQERAFATTQHPLNLMSTSATLLPSGFDFIFIDAPRATGRSSVNLWTADSDRKVLQKTFSLADPDYRFNLSANMLVIARYVKQCVADCGVAVVSTNIDMSSIVRNAFETVFSYEGFIGELVFQTRTGGGNDSRFMSVDHETLLVFAKSPEKVPKFTIQKPEKELNKYKHKDAKGKYYWDTYIRKQARNYYEITCPDGAALEFDENGNRISWLWREKTFKEKLSDGEVEFRELNGAWKLYYKDRIKETKILRSIVLQKDHLKDIFEGYPDETTGKELLTKEGSSEVRKYENKPDYLKSSKFYKFLFNAFARNAKRVLVPFPEHYCALRGLAGSKSEATIYTSVDSNYLSLFKERSSEDMLIQHYLSDASPISPLTATIDTSSEDPLLFFCNLISTRYSLVSDFFEFKSKDGLMLMYTFSGTTLFIVTLSDDSNLDDFLDEFVNTITKKAEFNNCEIFSQADMPDSSISELKIPYNIHQIPEEFLA